MFAARFDPLALVQAVEEPALGSKRKLSDAELSSEDEDEDSEKSEVEKDQDSEDSESDSGDTDESEADSDDSDDEKHNSDSEKVLDISDNDGDLSMKDQDEEEEPQEPLSPQEHDSKYSSIISRFTKSIKNSNEMDTDSDDSEEEEQVEQHDVGPLPQPALPRDFRLSRNMTTHNLNWLAEPMYIKTDVTQPFTDFALSPKILKNLQSMGFESAFASQIKTLEILLPEINNKLNPNAIKGDVLVNASTGSGKTLAYCIPIIQALQERVVPHLRAIILVPTKPLINQVYKTLVSLSKGIDLNIVTLGKSDISMQEEHLKLVSNVPDIVISTPGRLVDHLNLQSFSLKDLTWCVIDEADRLLNQSFQDWSNVLISKLNEVDDGKNISKVFKPNLTKMIFSATLTTDSGKLSSLQFHTPRLIIVNNEDAILRQDKIFTLPTTLKEHTLKFPSSASSFKPLYLLRLLQHLSLPKDVLVFTKSNESTLRLSKLLSILTAKLGLDLVVSNVNSQLSRSSKSKLLDQFANGEVHVLISTDLIARGIDISTIKHVINYDLPNSGREYVHRVGRTARANQNGDAYNFIIGRGEDNFFNKFSMMINRSQEIESIALETVGEEQQDLYRAALKELESQVFQKK